MMQGAATATKKSLAVATIMIVDDSFLMRRVIRNIIESDPGFTVCGEASDGADALKKLEELVPDIILLDIEMPQIDGIEFLKRAKMITDAMIIVISSITQPGSPQAMEVLALGVADVIAKPSGVLSLDMEDERRDDLLEAIHACLGY